MKDDAKEKRPLVLSIVCWLVIVVSGLAIIRNVLTLTCGHLVPELAAALQTPVSRWSIPGWALYVQSTVARIVFLVAAVAMLKRKAWGRIIVLALIPLSFVFYIALAGFVPTLIRKAIFSALYIGILLLPSVRRYFHPAVQTRSENGEAPTTDSTVSSGDAPPDAQ